MPAKNQPHRRKILRFLAAFTIGGGSVAFSSSLNDVNDSSSDHVAWVAESLKRMLTVKPGMSRDQLLLVFSTEGGISTALQRTFVSRDCPFFKVDVAFRRATNPDEGAARKDLLVERGDDLVTTISRPYLQFSIMD